MQQCKDIVRLNSSGGSLIDRTSSEESEVNGGEFRKESSPPNFAASSSSDSPRSDDFDLTTERRPRSSVPFMFPPVSSSSASSSLNVVPVLTRKISTPAESRITPYASKAISAVNRIAERLKRLKQIEDENESQNEKEEEIVSDILQTVAGLRQSTLSNVSARFQQRLVAECTRSDSTTEHAILLGRCFNLSMNLKILSQSTVLDPTIAGRVISDLSVLENSMRSRNEKEAEVSSIMNKLTLGGKGLVIKRDGRPRLGFL